jgi:hypothetical protein
VPRKLRSQLATTRSILVAIGAVLLVSATVAALVGVVSDRFEQQIMGNAVERSPDSLPVSRTSRQHYAGMQVAGSALRRLSSC